MTAMAADDTSGFNRNQALHNAHYGIVMTSGLGTTTLLTAQRKNSFLQHALCLVN